MDFKLGKINLHAVAQGVGGLVFGGDNQSSANEDSFVERYLDRISNGVRAEDRRAAMLELQSLVAESRSAQLAFGAMGFPVLMGVLKEERDDLEMVRGALETLISALTPIDPSHGLKSDVQPDLMNSDLLSREPENISLLLSLLSEEDFYVRYYTLQLLTALLTKSPNWLQEAILAIPRGITRLVDMLLDREVIRNEALLLLTYLTHEAEEIQKILVFEGVFEKIFSIIKEEGGSEGGVVVQDCLVLLNNVIRNNASNQILLRETVGLEPLVSNFKLRKGSTYRFSQQKTVNLLNALETIGLLLVGGGEAEPGKDANRVANQTVLAQKNILDHLLMLGVESKWAPVAVRCSALHCIGDLIVKNPHNLDLLARMVGEDSHAEPALNSILRILLWTSSVYEFIAADYVLKCFCEKNTEGQVMLASTMIEPQSSSNETPEEDVHMSFGSILLSGIVSSGTDGDLQTCSRAASVLSHILKDNVQSKERVLRNEIEAPLASLVEPDPLMHRFVKYLARAASMKTKEPDHGNSLLDGDSFIQPVILRLLITWLADCPDAVNLFLASPTHLTFLIELVSNRAGSIYVRSLGAVLLGFCVLYNKNPGDDGRDSFAVVDTICRTIGLTAYFLIFEEMQKSILFVSATSTQYRKPLTRSNTASMTDLEDEDAEIVGIDDRQHEHPFFLAIFDRQFVNFIKGLEAQIRECIVDVFSHPKRKVAVVPAELEQKDGESSEEYIKRLKSFVEKQCNEMQDLLGRNAILAEDLAKNGENSGSFSDQKVADGRDRVQSDTLRRQLHEAKQSIETLKSEKAKIEAEASMCRNMARKIESDLKSLSDAYNSLEKDNFRLDSEVKALRRGEREAVVDLEVIRVEAKEEAQKESEVELNDLLVCLGQEQTKVEKLSTRLIELGEDVDSLLEGIGDDAGLPESGEDED